MATRKQEITEAARKRRQRAEAFMTDVSVLALIVAVEHLVPRHDK